MPDRSNCRRIRGNAVVASRDWAGLPRAQGLSTMCGSGGRSILSVSRRYAARIGAVMMAAFGRRFGYLMNHKKLLLVYREENGVVTGRTMEAVTAPGPHQHWSFVSETLSCGDVSACWRRSTTW